MRLTTKIIIGLISSIFLLSFVFIIGISFIDTQNYERRSNVYTSSISQENLVAVAIDVPFQTICLDEVKHTQYEKNLNISGLIRHSPVTSPEDQNQLFLPKELLEFVDTVSSNDTLFIRLKMDAIHDRYAESSTRDYMVIDGFNFFVHAKEVDVVCHLQRIKVDVRNHTTDNIRIQTSGSIEIDSCKANRIEPSMNNRWQSFLLKNSQVKELTIDLDQIGRQWKVENCEIEVENLTGSGKHSVVQPKSEAKIMNWIPKNKDAQLTVTLHGDTARIEFP